MKTPNIEATKEDLILYLRAIESAGLKYRTALIVDPSNEDARANLDRMNNLAWQSIQNYYNTKYVT